MRKFIISPNRLICKSSTSNPYIDKVHFLEQSLLAIIKELKRENFDFIIDLHHNLRSMKVKDALKVKSYSYDKLNVRKWIYTSLKWNFFLTCIL